MSSVYWNEECSLYFMFFYVASCESTNDDYMLMSVCGTEGTSLCEKMKEILETNSQYFACQLDGIMGSKQTPRLEALSRTVQCNVLPLTFALNIL